MNIAIDASNLARPHRSGVATYGINLINHVASLDKENEYYLCYRLSRLKCRRFFYRVDEPNFRVKIFQEPFSFMFVKRIDLYHGLDARLCEYRKPKRVVTIHDILQYSSELPSTRHPKKKIRRYKEVMTSADRIIANSHFTKASILEHFSVPEDKIDVVYHGVEGRFEPKGPEEIQIVLKRYGISRPYLFYVGNIEIRKNLSRILEAFARISKDLSIPLQMVLAGVPGQGAKEVFQTIERLHLEGRVRLLGYVPLEDLSFLYSGAEMFLFPSFYEGFGLPLLEAMACGTAVITSNVTSLPEIAGDAALCVDPYDVDSIAAAIIQFLELPRLRYEYVQRGFQRIKKFTWESTARKTLAVYEKTL